MNKTRNWNERQKRRLDSKTAGSNPEFMRRARKPRRSNLDPEDHGGRGHCRWEESCKSSCAWGMIEAWGALVHACKDFDFLSHASPCYPTTTLRWFHVICSTGTDSCSTISSLGCGFSDRGSLQRRELHLTARTRAHQLPRLLHKPPRKGQSTSHCKSSLRQRRIDRSIHCRHESGVQKWFFWSKIRWVTTDR